MTDQINIPNRELLKDSNLRILFTVTLMAVIGISSLTPIFPNVMREFSIPSEKVFLLITAFTLPGVILGPFLGVFADRIGRKRVLVPSLFLFGIAGVACGFIRDFNVLIFLRFLQGIGAGMLATLSSTIVGDLFSGNNRISAMGLNASVLSVGTAVFPAVGGLLGALHWSLPFYLPVFAIPIGFWVMTSLDNTDPENVESLGGYLKGALKGILTLNVLLIFGLGLLTFVMLFGPIISYFPIWMAEEWKSGPVVIGMLLSISSFSSAFASSRLGGIRRNISVKNLLIIAYSGYALVFLIMPYMPKLWLLLVPIILFGIVQGLNIPSLMALVASAAPVEYRGSFMAINATVFRLGQTVGPALAAMAFLRWDFNGMFIAGSAAAMSAVLLVVLLGGGLSKYDQDVNNL